MQLAIHEAPPVDAPSTLNHALNIWVAGVERVRGESATRHALAEHGEKHWPAILSVGKAASSMMLGAIDVLAPDGRALVITKYDHVDSALTDDPRIEIIESGHPVPDKSSLRGGRDAIEFVERPGEDTALLVLVSGGASALVEDLVEGFDLGQLVALTDALLAEGYAIDQINQIRCEISQIKGGKLLRRFRGRRILVLALSDIPGDDMNLIGSGIGAIEPPRTTRFERSKRIAALMPRSVRVTVPDQSRTFEFRAELVGTNTLARQAAASAAEELGLGVVESTESLTGDVEELARNLAGDLGAARDGVYLWGGEPTVRLPDSPGRGGRNQSLAIALALELGRLDRNDIVAVIAGTDGTDGPTDAAGGIIFPGIGLDGAKQALTAADAEPWLRQANALLVTGPTGTNVMDLAVVIVGLKH